MTRHSLLYALLFLTVLMASCELEHSFKASLDGNNDNQGGISPGVSKTQFSYNLFLEMGTALNGVPLPEPKDNAGEEDFMAAKAPAGSFSVHFGPQFIQKASQLDGATQRLNYLEAVGFISYDYPLAQSGTLYGGLGPYLGYGLGGNLTDAGVKTSAFGSQGVGYKRFDAGPYITAGYVLPISLSFSLFYEYGLVDKSPDPSTYTSKNRSFGIDIGYSLNKLFKGSK
jgi:hypothetical protein